jgi:hypothetical protein
MRIFMQQQFRTDACQLGPSHRMVGEGGARWSQVETKVVVPLVFQSSDRLSASQLPPNERAVRLGPDGPTLDVRQGGTVG